MLKEHDEKMRIKLKGARELPEDLPHTVQEEKKHRGLPLLLTAAIG